MTFPKSVTDQPKNPNIDPKILTGSQNPTGAKKIQPSLLEIRNPMKQIWWGSSQQDNVCCCRIVLPENLQPFLMMIVSIVVIIRVNSSPIGSCLNEIWCLQQCLTAVNLQVCSLGAISATNEKFWVHDIMRGVSSSTGSVAISWRFMAADGYHFRTPAITM